jgi:hypothetical protein
MRRCRQWFLLSLLMLPACGTVSATPTLSSPTAVTTIPMNTVAPMITQATDTPSPTGTPLPPTVMLPSTNTPIPPTNTPALPTVVSPTVTQVPTPQPAPSGGLGLDVPDWERVYGRNTQNTPDARYLKFGKEFPYHKGTFPIAVTFDYFDRKTFVGPRRATDVLYTWDGRMTDLEARNTAKSLIPTDAQLLRTYKTPDGDIVQVGSSAWLKDQIPTELWTVGGSEPGIFSIKYSLNEQHWETQFHGSRVLVKDPQKIHITIGSLP